MEERSAPGGARSAAGEGAEGGGCGHLGLHSHSLRSLSKSGVRGAVLPNSWERPAHRSTNLQHPVVWASGRASHGGLAGAVSG